jgi:hypothetical protein
LSELIKSIHQRVRLHLFCCMGPHKNGYREGYNQAVTDVCKVLEKAFPKADDLRATLQELKHI